MPIWLRNFTTKAIMKQMQDEADAQQEAMEKASGVQKATPQNSIPVPPVPKKSPTYTTKVGEK